VIDAGVSSVVGSSGRGCESVSTIGTSEGFVV
jgi:hypothetical protein